MRDQNIPEPIKEAVNELKTRYANSPHTTNAGFALRLIARFVTLDLLLKLLSKK